MRVLMSALLATLIAFSIVLTAFASDSISSASDFDYFDAQPWELPADAEPMRVANVHDGDSINLSEPDDTWWEKYRLIGIQAPEIEGYRDEECHGPESAGFLKDLLPVGTILWVQQDISDKDKNGRFLRHVFIQDKETGDYYLLSEVLVLGGYARANSYPPDDLYDDVLQEAEEDAVDNGDGMWACPEWKKLIDD